MIRVSLYISGRLVTKTTFESYEVVLGRDPTCDVVIDNLGVSRRHARIFHNGDSWAVEDLGSSNGLHISGSQVRKHVLLDDDEFGIGKYTVKFEALAGAPIAAAAAMETATSASLSTLSGEHGDLTFALDRRDLDRILAKARAPSETETRVSRLTRIKPKKPPLVVLLKKGHSLAGTAKTSNIRLKGWFTPRRAALFVQENGRDLVISLSDSNRVKVNKVRVDSRTLADGDLIQIGKHRFIYSR